jgi:hypothetical protein
MVPINDIRTATVRERAFRKTRSLTVAVLINDNPGS